MRPDAIRQAFPLEIAGVEVDVPGIKAVNELLAVVEALAKIRTFEDWTVVSALRERAREALK